MNQDMIAQALRFLVESLKLVFCGMAVATIAVTVTRAAISEPFRDWVGARSKFFGELVSCPYCASHWLSFMTVLLVGARPVQTSWLVLDYAVSVFAAVCIAAYFVRAIVGIYSNLPGVKHKYS